MSRKDVMSQIWVCDACEDSPCYYIQDSFAFRPNNCLFKQVKQKPKWIVFRKKIKDIHYRPKP